MGLARVQSKVRRMIIIAAMLAVSWASFFGIAHLPVYRQGLKNEQDYLGGSGDGEMDKIKELALDFAHALVAGEYDKAHGLLSLPLQRRVSPAELAQEYDAMHSYVPDPADTVESAKLDDAGLQGALGWQWVTIGRLLSPVEPWKLNSGHWNEGVTLLIVEEDDRLAIDDIVWGRP
jgi:hypothetical protein